MELIQPLHNQRGFTMIEMLVSMLIMAVGVLATLSLVSTSMNANSHANRLTTKTSLAQQMMEDLLSQKDITVPASNVVYNLNLTGSNNDLTAPGGGTFHATYSTIQLSPSLIRINITVSSVPDDGSPLITSTYRCSE